MDKHKQLYNLFIESNFDSTYRHNLSRDIFCHFSKCCELEMSFDNAKNIIIENRLSSDGFKALYFKAVNINLFKIWTFIHNATFPNFEGNIFE